MKSELIQLNPDFNMEVTRAQTIDKQISLLDKGLQEERLQREKEEADCEIRLNQVIKKFK